MDRVFVHGRRSLHFYQNLSGAANRPDCCRNMQHCMEKLITHTTETGEMDVEWSAVHNVDMSKIGENWRMNWSGSKRWRRISSRIFHLSISIPWSQSCIVRRIAMYCLSQRLKNTSQTTRINASFLVGYGSMGRGLKYRPISISLAIFQANGRAKEVASRTASNQWCERLSRA